MYKDFKKYIGVGYGHLLIIYPFVRLKLGIYFLKFYLKGRKMSRLWNFYKKKLSSNTIQNTTIKMFDSF